MAIDYKKVAEKLAEMIQGVFVRKHTSSYCTQDCIMQKECLARENKLEVLCDRLDFAEKLVQKLGEEADENTT